MKRKRRPPAGDAADGRTGDIEMKSTRYCITNNNKNTGVANHIHGMTPAGFNVTAADVDGNDVIDVRDYTGVANIIHTGSITGNNNASARKKTDMREPQ